MCVNYFFPFLLLKDSVECSEFMTYSSYNTNILQKCLIHYKWVSVSNLYKVLASVLGYRDAGVQGEGRLWWERGVQIASVPRRKCYDPPEGCR